MRFRNPENKETGTKSGTSRTSSRRETAPRRELAADDQPQLEGLSDREAAAVIAARFGFGAGPKSGRNT